MKNLIDDKKQFELINNIIQRSDTIINRLYEEDEKNSSLFISVTLVLMFLHQVSGYLPIFFKIRNNSTFEFDLLIDFEETLTKLIESWKNFDTYREEFKHNWQKFLVIWGKIYTHIKTSLGLFDFQKIHLN